MVKRYLPILLLFFLLVSSANLQYARATTSTLYEFIDDYDSEDHVQAKDDVTRNATFDAMMLEWFPGDGFGYENFTIYTEVDEQADITRNDTHIRWQSMRRDADSYVYYDFGVNYFNGFTHNLTLLFEDIEAGDANNRHYIIWLAVSNVANDQQGMVASEAIYVYARQDAAIDDKWFFGLRWDDSPNPATILEGIAHTDMFTWHYLSLIRSSQVATLLVSMDNFVTITSNITITNWGARNDQYRYLQPLTGIGALTDPADHSSGYEKNLWIGDVRPGAFEVDGYFYTTDVLSTLNGSSIVLLTNYSSNTGSVTVEFSNDNATWVNHNGAPGSETLVNGFESIDIRDLAYATLYMRYNFTRGGPVNSPELNQIRVVVSGPVSPGPSPGGVVNVWPYVALALVFCLLVFALQRR